MNTGFSFGDFFKFDKMIAPMVLKVVYWIGLVGIAIYMLVVIVGGLGMMSFSVGTGLGMILGAFVGGAIGFLFWRVVIELYMTIFGIHDRLGEIRDSLKK